MIVTPWEMMTPERWRDIQKLRRSEARYLADKLESGAELNEQERENAALGLRRYASMLPDGMPKTKGAPPKFPAMKVAIDVVFAEEESEGRMRKGAIESAAAIYGVTPTAIKQRIKEHEEAARRFLGYPQKSFQETKREPENPFLLGEVWSKKRK